MNVRKAIIPAAGLGTRLLPLTKEIPKEMFPLFDNRGGFSFKPLIQIIFEKLYEAGLREFCIITGRGKRALEDYFLRDDGYLAFLSSIGKQEATQMLRSLYEMVENTGLLWMNQPRPTGLGAAVLMAEPFIGEEPFVVHAGDTYIAYNDYVSWMLDTFNMVKPEALFLTTEVPDPENYGVVEKYRVESDGLYRVLEVVEKPKCPKTNVVIVPVYVFASSIFNALRSVGPGSGGEIQLTDAIQMIAESDSAYALRLKDCEDYVDIGRPESYLRALKKSHRLALGAR